MLVVRLPLRISEPLLHMNQPCKQKSVGEGSDIHVSLSSSQERNLPKVQSVGLVITSSG